MGIDEDPVTGSLHTVLAPFWSRCRRDGVAGDEGEDHHGLYFQEDGDGKGGEIFSARQCSPRGGNLGISLRDDDGRIQITGPATVVVRGQLVL